MAGRIVKEVTQTITGVATMGRVTVASSVGFYAGAYGYLRAAGQPGLTIRVVAVPDATHVDVRVVLDPRGGGQGTTAGDIRSDANYGFTDPTAYNTGQITMPEQLVYNPNDAALT